jgi:hypothetical protein
MAGKTYDNSGLLSRNDKKTEPGHADHNGSCTIDGKEFWINAWIKEKDGRKFFSLSFRPKQPKSQGGQSSKEQQRTYTVDDDTPF